MVHVSASASRACAWVLGMLEAHKWRVGRGHERLDSLPASFLGSAAMNKKSIVDKTSIAAKKNHRYNLAMRALRSGGISTKDTNSTPRLFDKSASCISPLVSVDYHATINNNLQVVGTGTNTTSFDNIDSQDKEPLHTNT